MNTFSKGGEDVGEVLRSILSKAFESILGSSGAMALRFHVERRLGRDMYDVFCEDPGKFYRALNDCFGRGAESIMLIVARWLSGNGYVDNLRPDEFIKLLQRGGEEAAQIIRRSFKLARQG
jgi:hypothetical protein